MDPSLLVLLAFLPFVLSHIGLAVPGLRSALVERLGPWGFTWLFFVVAALTFGLAISTYAGVQGTGAPGPALGDVPVLRELLIGALVLGIVLMAGSLAEFGRSPYSITRPGVSEPTGLSRVTRHPFFVGVGLLGGGHALLATHLPGAIAMGTLGVFALVGSHFQDRKLVAQRGQDYADYVRSTSLVPFVAILAGRQRLVVREISATGLAIGLGLAWGLRFVHPHIFDYGGMYVIGATVGGALLILAGEARRMRHAAPDVAIGTSG